MKAVESIILYLMKFPKKSHVKILIGLGIVAVILFFIYSIYSYKKIELAVDGFLTCAQGRCFWTNHIHTLVLINVCGQTRNLPKFKGPLNAAHTHAEDNVIHWHDKLEVFPDTKEFFDPKPLTLRSAFTNLDISLNKDGEKCPDGSIGTLKMFVNGNVETKFDEYKWNDQDIINIIFDSRSLEQVEEDLKNKPINFPRLGEG